MGFESFDVEFLLSDSDNERQQDVLEKVVACEKKRQSRQEKNVSKSEFENRKLAKLVSKH